jgi:hypothetical protein
MKSALPSLAVTALFLAFAPNVASAQCTTPDVFEPNDSCGTAAAITPGLHTGLTVTGSFAGQASPDFYAIDVPAGERLLVEVYHDWAEDEDLNLYLYDSSLSTCGDQFNVLRESFTWTDNEAISWTNTGGTTVSCTIEVAAWDLGVQPTVCDDYDLRVSVGVADCVLGNDDGFEPNDSCAAAVALAPGLHTDLVTSPTSADFYRVTLAAGERLTADVLYGEELQDSLIIELYDGPTCASRVDSDALGGTNTVTWANASGQTRQTTLVVRSANRGSCNEYSLQLAVGPAPCLAVSDDSLEPNDTCATSAVVTTETQANRFVSIFSPDYYRITVPPGDRLIADVTYALAGGALIAEVYSDAACTILVDNIGWTGADQVQYANPTAAPSTSPSSCGSPRRHRRTATATTRR